MSNIIDKIRLSGTDYTLSATTSGVSVIEVTQAQYDALPSSAKTDTSKMYVITDAEAGDLTQYWTSAQTQSAITQATSGKVDSSSVVSSVTSASTDSEIPTAKAVWDVASQGGGGGGKAIEAGRGISVTTGETADTVSFNLPISAGTGTNSIVEGYNTKASGHSSHAEGYNTIAKGSQAHSEGRNTTASGVYSHAEGENTYAGGSKSHTEGSYTEANNEAEHASGQFNVSSKADTTFGNSGNTLFSVGNGTSTSARHNAFEVRQNGDIYLTLDGQDVKLQDHLGGGGGGGKAVSGGTNISITTGIAADTINCTLPIREGSNSSGKGIIVGDSECTANGQYAISLGHSSDADGAYSFCNGSNSYARGQMSFAYGNGCDATHDLTFMFGHSNVSTKSYQYSFGRKVKPKNELEFGFGTYNNSSSATTTFGHSGNTMFSIGNGYDFSSTHNWHNAFEVRQNGDIYVPNTDDTSVTGDYAYSLYPMVRLQDTITATAANTTALGGLSLVKLTQAEYDSLSPNYDSNTLYVIVN